MERQFIVISLAKSKDISWQSFSYPRYTKHLGKHVQLSAVQAAYSTPLESGSHNTCMTLQKPCPPSWQTASSLKKT
eukprot:13188390-Ditylum_brightwellii.AAC.1